MKNQRRIQSIRCLLRFLLIITKKMEAPSKLQLITLHLHLRLILNQIRITARKEEEDLPKRILIAMMMTWIVIHLFNTTRCNLVSFTKKKLSLLLMSLLTNVSLTIMAAQDPKMAEDRLDRMRAKLLNLLLILQPRYQYLWEVAQGSSHLKTSIMMISCQVKQQEVDVMQELNAKLLKKRVNLRRTVQTQSSSLKTPRKLMVSPISESDNVNFEYLVCLKILMIKYIDFCFTIHD